MPVRYVAPVKPARSLVLDCAGADHKLDVGGYTPDRDALTFAQIYLNVDAVTLLDPTKPARLRVFMRRAAWQGEPVDDTYHDDLWLIPGRPTWGTLRSRAEFEWADAGRALTWRYEVDGAKAVTLSTRYVKYVQVW